MLDEAKFNPSPPAAAQLAYDGEDFSQNFDQLYKRKSVRCCGCTVAVLLIISVTVIVLFTTVFRVHDPTVLINIVMIQRPEMANNGTIRTDVNVTLLSDVSIKNPNVAGFKLTDTITSVYYNGTLVGEVTNYAGGTAVKARRSFRRNVTVELIPDKIMGAPSFGRDISLGSLTLRSSSRISGRVKIIKIIKKELTVELDCTTIYHTNRNQLEGQTTCNAHHA